VFARPKVDGQGQLGRALGDGETLVQGVVAASGGARDTEAPEGRPLPLGQELGEAVEAVGPWPRAPLVPGGGAQGSRSLLALLGAGAVAAATTTGAREVAAASRILRFLGAAGVAVQGQAPIRHSATSLEHQPANAFNVFHCLSLLGGP
jgi:hypothetical protein